MDVQNLPIDIHSSKLLDWLISRRHCKKEWQEEVLRIRQKISDAIRDMPEHPDILQLLSGTYINYFHCVRIVEILKETEKDSKNFLGYYSSQRMKDWQEVIRRYEKDSVYLAEAAGILSRLVQYEIPGVKKQIAKLDANLQELEKKELDYCKQSREAERKFNQEAEGMGIKGERVREELAALADGLPAFLHTLARQTRKLDTTKQRYAIFRQFILRRKETESGLLPTLSLVMAEGNVTAYQWRTGKTPLSIQEFQIIPTEGQALELEDEQIDFGEEALLDETDLAEMSIDFGDFEVVPEQEIVALNHLNGTPTPLCTPDDGVARGEEALSILELPHIRQLFVQDLRELECFLRARLMESGSEQTADFLLASQIARDPLGRAATEASREELESDLAQVQEILRQINDPYKRHLAKIRASKKYLDSLTEELEGKKEQPRRLRSLGEAMKQRQMENRQETGRLQPQLQLLIQRTKALQRQIEADISKRYKGRPVNIMGGIQAAVGSA